MITLTIDGNMKIEGASSKEEATAAVKEVAGSTEIDAITKRGPDESPVFYVNLMAHVVTLEEGEIKEAPPVPEEPTQEAEAGGKAEFEEVKD